MQVKWPLGVDRSYDLYVGAYTFQITITKSYSSANLFEDLRALYKLDRSERAAGGFHLHVRA